MALQIDWTNQNILVTSPQTDVLVQDLIDFIRTEEASVDGIPVGQIASASGKESLGGTAAVGITLELVSPWQLKFWEGNYIATVSGGNLLGGPAGDPIAYSAGVQTLLIQSAASTLVVSSSGITTQDKTDIINGVATREVETGYTLEEAMRIALSALAGKSSGGGGSTITFRDINDTKDRIVANVDANSNRTSVTVDEE